MLCCYFAIGSKAASARLQLGHVGIYIYIPHLRVASVLTTVLVKCASAFDMSHLEKGIMYHISL